MSVQATGTGVDPAAGTSPAPPMNETGFYTLAGAPRSPRDLIGEVRAGEAMASGRRSSPSAGT